MPKYICEYCKGKFVKPSNLTKHQRTAKYCVQLQKEKITRDAQLTCGYCQRILSRSDSLNRHYVICIEYQIYLRTQVYQNEIKHLKERLAEKEQQLKDKELYIRELTNTAINKPTTQITSFGENLTSLVRAAQPIAEMDSTIYPSGERHTPPPQVTQLIDQLYRQVLDIFPVQIKKDQFSIKGLRR